MNKSAIAFARVRKSDGGALAPDMSWGCHWVHNRDRRDSGTIRKQLYMYIYEHIVGKTLTVARRLFR